MLFGMKNVPATFQWIIHMVIDGLEGCEAHINDIIVCSDTWHVTSEGFFYQTEAGSAHSEPS